MPSCLFLPLTLTRYTPGQKFAHWEHKGVKLRVEVGPREAARKRCTLAKTFQAGVPAPNPAPNPTPNPTPDPTKDKEAERILSFVKPCERGPEVPCVCVCVRVRA